MHIKLNVKYFIEILCERIVVTVFRKRPYCLSGACGDSTAITGK